jgi:hypothetical protein
MKQPDFIIIGAMKSATSSLHVQLGAQDGIFMSEPKEPNFFSDDDQHKRGTDFYLGLFAGAAKTDLCGESSTHYTKLPDYPQAVSRMKALLPSVKLIYVMRHPVERLISHYVHRWTEKVIRCDIDDALDRHPELIYYSRYGYQLEPYFEAFGRSSVLPVFLAALERRPQIELERIARFIGHPASVSWEPDLGKQNVSNRRFRRFQGYEFFVDSPPMVWLRRTLVPQSMRDLVKARLTMNERPVLRSFNLTRVQAIFDADLQILSSWLGVELTCDNFDELTGSGNLEWRA